jgi:hypothetical protein
MSIEVSKWKPFERATLCGFVSLKLTNIGLEIRSATFHRKNGKAWVGLPSRQYEKDDGSTGYAYIVDFYDKKKRWAFQDAAVKAIEEYIGQRCELIEKGHDTH